MQRPSKCHSAVSHSRVRQSRDTLCVRLVFLFAISVSGLFRAQFAQLTVTTDLKGEYQVVSDDMNHVVIYHVDPKGN